MLDDAQQEIINRYNHPRHRGKVAGADFEGRGANQSCGDEICLTGTFARGKMRALQHRSRACAVCSAAADLLCERVVGMSRAEIHQINPEEIKEELGIPLSPVRLKCALLPLETLKENLKEA